ncbi:fengycin family lipopeptide synthetase D/bacitracin synthase 2 [Chryseobacterium taeanense]|uniref:Fengycin family lipopeptide synthetase D/bacitracin synthase 2 n=1 Tax=Chryseobacterium taeanense TaxID=311334 RepID=A0A1G8PGR4_9FLAO|nr:non-ribosomal peptide synthetase [Chryseobacterium taeanense]SDI91689.1 fengycin family lipopeptide synthetase D/bacitracin synthase 2 [Chryseobacterium taeanense]
MEKLLLKILEKNVKIGLIGDQLKISFPKDFHSDSLIEEIRGNKEALIRHIRHLSQHNSGYTPIPAAPKKEYYALSSVQKRLYFIYKFDNSSLAYNMPQIVRLHGALDSDLLQSVFRSLISHYEILRTRIGVVSEVPVQYIDDHMDFDIEEYSCSESEIEGILTSFIRPFDLEKGPLLRVCVLHLSETEHILAVDMHHIITDGVSNGILLRSFMSLYRGESLPSLSVHYKDYSEWQQSSEHHSSLELHKNFWLEQFKGEIPVIDLPTDYSRPLVKRYEGDRVGFSLSSEQTEKLKNISGKAGGTMFMTTLSLYYILLKKLTGQDDLIIGTPVAGRDHVDLEHQVGMFVNTLALRSDCNGNESYTEFLNRVKSMTLDCFGNQLYQYESLLEDLKVARDTSRNPLFDVMFSYQNFEDPELSMGDLIASSYSHDHVDAKFDISLTVSEDKDQLFLSFEYSRNLFKRESIERFAGYFQKIVDDVTANPEISIKEIQMLPSCELDLILHEFNDTNVDYRNDKTILELFEQQVILNGNNIAIIGENQSLNYLQLNKKINQLSNYLIHSKKINKGDIVGVHFERGMDMIVSLLAILKIGAVYVALDPEYPVERINTIIEESEMNTVVTNLSHKISQHIRTDLTDIIAEKSLVEMESDQSPEIQVTGNCPAYIIYTSGSTGVPKGIVIGHDSLLDYSLTFRDYFSISEKDRVIQQSSLSFDTSVEEIFPALISGGAIIIVSSGGRDAENLIQNINMYQATILSTTPLVLNEINSSVHLLGKSLRAIISGGDNLSANHIDGLIKVFPVYNTYGPSESTVCITYYRLEDLSQISVIGKPIANRKIYILDQYGKPCPLGVTGEIYVAGKGLAKGYLNNTALTHEKFIENKNIKGQRIYSTGDLGKWLSDGNIQFAGRRDNQLKIRGYRVELEEIENRLLDHPDISEAIVICKEKNNHKYLLAFYKSERTLGDTELKTFLSLSLPDYMVPVSYCIVQDIPMLVNGKPDRKKLTSLEIEVEQIHLEPENEIEERLTQIWSEILHIDPELISTNASFFKLGGHSLKAVSLANKIEKRWNTKISLQEIFYNTTIQLIAKIIESQMWISHTADKSNDQHENNNIKKIII